MRAADLESLIIVQAGQTFSQAMITATEERLMVPWAMVVSLLLPPAVFLN